MFVYGAYRYATRPLEPSNEEFDRWLKAAIRFGRARFRGSECLAQQNGLTLAGDRAMPGNNRCIWWTKTSGNR